ncbi:MAG: cyclic nucleotide-binding domain-containing protein [Pseudomonadota bacterium]
MLLTIEKVIILKSVSIFSETPEDILADIASTIEELTLQPGDAVFEKGDPGQEMYIIVSGEMRVHDGDKTIASLRTRDVFGELAALDPEPRMATVTAEKETHLFKLRHDVIFELMTEHVDVAKGIIRVLCQRLRCKV